MERMKDDSLLSKMVMDTTGVNTYVGASREKASTDEGIQQSYQS